MPIRSGSSGSISLKLKLAFFIITFSILATGAAALYFMSQLGDTVTPPHAIAAETPRLIREEIRETSHLMQLYTATRYLAWWDRAQQPIQRALLHADDALLLHNTQNNDALRREGSATKAALMRYSHAIQRTREVTEATQERTRQVSLGIQETRLAIALLRTALLDDMDRLLTPPDGNIPSTRNLTRIREQRQHLLRLDELSIRAEATFAVFQRTAQNLNPEDLRIISETLSDTRAEIQLFQPDPEAGARVWLALERTINGLRSTEYELTRTVTAIQNEHDLSTELLASTEELAERLDRLEQQHLSAVIGRRQTLQSSLGFGQGVVSLLAILSALMSLVIGFVLNQHISASLSSLAGSLRSGTDQVGTESKKMAIGSAQLVQNASDQTAGLQQTLLAVNQMMESNEKASRRAKETMEQVRQAGKSAGEGAVAATQLQATMLDLREDMQKISQAVKKVDDLVMQTKVMALSTAIEAARAGEVGRNLMVVSLELGEVAQRSVEAAQSATGLVNESRQRTESGVAAAAEATLNAEQIRAGADLMGPLISELLKDTSYQRMTMGQVCDIIKRLDRSVEKNATVARDSAASAEKVLAQNGRLCSVLENADRLAGGASGMKSRKRGSSGSGRGKGKGGKGEAEPADPVDGMGIEMVSAGGSPPTFVPAK
jgi:hypothetical protein